MKEMTINPSETIYIMTVKYVARENVVTTYRRFYSYFGAQYVAKKIATCEDVISIDVVNDMTGEVIFFKDSHGELWCEE